MSTSITAYFLLQLILHWFIPRIKENSVLIQTLVTSKTRKFFKYVCLSVRLSMSIYFSEQQDIYPKVIAHYTVSSFRDGGCNKLVKKPKSLFMFVYLLKMIMRRFYYQFFILFRKSIVEQNLPRDRYLFTLIFNNP